MAGAGKPGTAARVARRSRNAGREVNGVVLLDKPGGMTSNEALQKVKRLFQARKAGHTGSLDRSAEGMLPLCLGEATKFSQFLLHADKQYLATLQMGIETTTGDAAGEIVSRRDVPELDTQKVETILEAFRGPIEQVPPMYSAIKHRGQRLYELAYQGIEVERAPRTVTIHELVLIGVRPDAVDIRVSCSKGTYIRTLAQDIGARIGCGAHVLTLRRTGVGPFTEQEMVSMNALESAARDDGLAGLDACLLDTDAILRDDPAVELAESVAYYLRQGQPVIVPHAPTRGLVRIYAQGGAFLGVGEVLDDGRIAPRRLMQSG